MGGVAWVFVGAAAVATLVALLVFLVPLGRDGGRAVAAPRGAAPTGAPGHAGPAGSLARGFSYLHVSPRTSGRRGSVHERLERAYRRVDAVDPHEAPRRIGEALLQAGLTDSAARPTDPPRTRSDRVPLEHPREQQ